MGCGMKKHATDTQNCNVNLSVKGRLKSEIALGKISHLIDPEIRKMLVRGLYGNENSMIHSDP